MFELWPEAVAAPIADEVNTVLTTANLGLMTVGILLALFFASNGVEAVRVAIGRAYEDDSTAPFWRQRLQSLARALAREARAGSERWRARIGAAAGRLESLSPLAVLGRGYAIARRARDATIVRRADQVAPGDALAIRVAEGEIDADVRAVRSPRDG